MEGKDVEIDSVSSMGDNTSITTTGDILSAPEKEIAASETRWVNISKLVVFSVLLSATTLCGLFTYRYTTQKEEEEFKSQFDDYGSEILDLSQITARNVFETIESMSTTITSYAHDVNATWPFVSIPDYAARGAQLLRVSGSYYLALTPLVSGEEREEWEQYSVENQGWLHEGQSEYAAASNETISPYIWKFDYSSSLRIPQRETDNPLYGPFWQITPPVAGYVNQNIFAVPFFHQVHNAMLQSHKIVLAPAFSVSDEPTPFEFTWPQSYITAPVYRSLQADADMVAMYSAVLPWHKYFQNAIPDGLGGIYVVVRNTCNQEYTYLVTGKQNVTYIGPGDLHDTRYSDMELTAGFDVLETLTHDGTCEYTLHVFPSESFEKEYTSDDPTYYTVVVVSIFLLTSAVFVIYDCLVKRKDTKVMTSAVNSNAIVSSLFPAQVRDRLIEDAANQRKNKKTSKELVDKTAKSCESGKELLLQNKPIADLFPNATVLFADIGGFTAWASVRDPSQVFTLLEQIYGSFDIIAKRRGVFKVETIGDCYVAATGLPVPKDDHAENMTRFARDCINKMNQTVQDLEVLLGPGTAELSMRFGLHSGPVTAGVLRGEKSRFQLFGDTVNTAERMESTGVRNRIQVSQETADELIRRGKGHWLKPREDMVSAKGKGVIQTYWIDFSRAGSSGSPENDMLSAQMESPDDDEEESETRHTMKLERLIDWNVEVLKGLLKHIVAMRDYKPKLERRSKSHRDIFKISRSNGDNVLDEVKEIISLPGKTAIYKRDPDALELDPEVVSQLHEYVTAVSEKYQDNPFHNFEHASHVTQSVTKLLGRVTTPDSIDYKEMEYVRKGKASTLHEYTYGITSDPLTQFACAFSAVIHDVDHPGVPNNTIVNENTDIAQRYRNKSVAEQHSVDLAWNLLEEDRFTELRRAIYSTPSELARFRQLVVNSVMATDIADKELKALRNARWDRAFQLDDSSSIVSETTTRTTAKDDADRKATIVIEHLIQASDVSHTMQHWHVYLKWNERLFLEMYKAFLEGRTKDDPSQTWYEGELGFFDFYLIPLCKKLKECSVFGVSSDEYLNYAKANRKEWEAKGKDVVAGYMEKIASGKTQ